MKGRGESGEEGVRGEWRYNRGGREGGGGVSEDGRGEGRRERIQQRRGREEKETY